MKKTKAIILVFIAAFLTSAVNYCQADYSADILIRAVDRDGILLKILNPISSATYENGNTLTIKWEQTGLKAVNIMYTQGVGTSGDINFQTITDNQSNGEYSWTIPDKLVGQKARIMIYGYPIGPSVIPPTVYSDEIKIVSKVKVVSHSITGYSDKEIKLEWETNMPDRVPVRVLMGEAPGVSANGMLQGGDCIAEMEADTKHAIRITSHNDLTFIGKANYQFEDSYRGLSEIFKEDLLKTDNIEISDVKESDISGSSITESWTTNIATKYKLFVFTYDPEKEIIAKSSDAKTTSHKITLDGLSAGKTYKLIIEAYNDGKYYAKHEKNISTADSASSVATPSRTIITTPSQTISLNPSQPAAESVSTGQPPALPADSTSISISTTQGKTMAAGLQTAGSGLSSLKITLGNQELHARLGGKIIIKAEDAGKAYYINPKNEEMYFLGRPDDAFQVMRKQGKGISNGDLEKISIGSLDISGQDSDNDGLSDALENAIGTDIGKADSDGDGYGDKDELKNGYSPVAKAKKIAYDSEFGAKQKGMIFLQVEKNGEAWYVNPKDGKRYFLGRPADAFKVMRELGLGISNADYDKLVQ